MLHALLIHRYPDSDELADEESGGNIPIDSITRITHTRTQISVEHTVTEKVRMGGSGRACCMKHCLATYMYRVLMIAPHARMMMSIMHAHAYGTCTYIHVLELSVQAHHALG